MSMTVGSLNTRASMTIAQQFPGNIPTYAASGPFGSATIASEVVTDLLKNSPSPSWVGVFTDSDGQFYVTRLKVDEPSDVQSALAALRRIHGNDIVPFSFHKKVGAVVHRHFANDPPPAAPRR